MTESTSIAIVAHNLEKPFREHGFAHTMQQIKVFMWQFTTIQCITS